MPLLTLTEVVGRPNKGWSVAAFDVINLEMTRAVFQAAQLENAPLIIMVYSEVFKQYGKALAALVDALARDTYLPVALHLDHARDIETIVQALRWGFTSVMIDASSLPLKDNIALTKKVVKLAHACGVDVEAEIGHVPFWGEEANFSGLTKVEEAVEFIQATGVDALAVSVGNVHCAPSGKVEVNLELLRDIRASVETALVIHGGTGLSRDTISILARNGVDKFNFFTDVWQAYYRGLMEAIGDNPTAPNSHLVIEKPMKAANEAIREKIRYCGCAGKAAVPYAPQRRW